MLISARVGVGAAVRYVGLGSIPGVRSIGICILRLEKVRERVRLEVVRRILHDEYTRISVLATSELGHLALPEIYCGLDTDNAYALADRSCLQNGLGH